MLNDFLKNAKKMQEDMKKIQEDLKKVTFEGSAGGGVVTAKVTGELVLKEIKIKPELLKPEEAEMLEDLILAAVNQAAEKSRSESNKKMNSLASGVDMQGLFNALNV